MATKLTLSLDERVIDRAKRIARRRGKSLSKMVEEFFNSIPERNSTSVVERIEKRIAPYLDHLTIPENPDYSALAREWKYKDYLEDTNKGK